MATFIIGGTTATFTDVRRGTSQESGDIEKLSIKVTIASQAEWVNLLSLVTTKYHVHVPLGGTPILDIVNGPGEGTLTIPGLGSATAVLISAKRNDYLRTVTQGQADFLIKTVWT